MSTKNAAPAEIDELDLESQEFREALLSRLNGQSEDLQRIIKMVDNRFKSQATRMQNLRAQVNGISENIGPVIDDVKFVKRLAALTASGLGLASTAVGILVAMGVI